jgi:hypothetical protein
MWHILRCLYPEDGGSSFLRNVDNDMAGYITWRHKSSATYFSESPREGSNFSVSVVKREVHITGIVTGETDKRYKSGCIDGYT